MKRKLINLLMCLTMIFAPIADAGETVARITYYWGHSQTSTGQKPKVLQTAAVDPKVIKYGSRIEIPALGKTVTANDTGSAVISRKASKAHGRNNIVVDVFVSSAKEAAQLQKKVPMFTKIIIHERK